MAVAEEQSIDFLWQSFLNGDDNCFSLIYNSTVNGLLNYGLKFSMDRDLVHDCLQEVFIDLFLKRKKSGNKIQKLKPYLFVAVRNGIVKRIVKENRFRFVNLDEMNDTLDFNIEYSEEHKVITSEKSTERNDKLLGAVKNLAPRQKEIVYLKFEEELEYNEIAEIMKISVESARKSMHRAVLALRNLLDKESFQTLLFVFAKKRFI
ncbi:sigma-70 family RNA polymerase sigma factor [uncultured Draconibacterium sp.]|uniref:RNA polymerase sigma factor n=1 Tax=uncultured Draconibacterium sp. TaxID=1573823 RepID=UPI003216996C